MHNREYKAEILNGDSSLWMPLWAHNWNQLRNLSNWIHLGSTYVWSFPFPLMNGVIFFYHVGNSKCSWKMEMFNISSLTMT